MPGAAIKHSLTPSRKTLYCKTCAPNRTSSGEIAICSNYMSNFVMKDAFAHREVLRYNKSSFPCLYSLPWRSLLPSPPLACFAFFNTLPGNSCPLILLSQRLLSCPNKSLLVRRHRWIAEQPVLTCFGVSSGKDSCCSPTQLNVNWMFAMART